MKQSQRLGLVVAVSAAFLAAVPTIAQTAAQTSTSRSTDDRYRVLRRPGEARPRTMSPTGTLETRADQRVTTDTRRALGSRMSTFDEQQIRGPAPNRRLSTRVLGRINTRIDTRLGGESPTDGASIDTDQITTPSDNVRR